MRRIMMLGIAGLAMGLACQGQVQVDLVMDKTQFLPKETLMLGVKITNLSGQPLRLGEDDEWISFMVEGQKSKPIIKETDMPVRQPFVVESSKVVTRYLNLAPYYPLSQPGRYRVGATVKIKEWDQRVESPYKSFEIVKGFTLWAREFGVPLASGQGGTSAPPEVRRYSLQKVTAANQILLYLCLSDASGGTIYRVQLLGPMVTFSQPETQMDKASNLHVLCQFGAKWFFYVTVNPAGELISRQTYYYTTRPTLKPDGEGGVKVAGGMRQSAASDIPPADAALPADKASPPGDPPGDGSKNPPPPPPPPPPTPPAPQP